MKINKSHLLIFLFKIVVFLNIIKPYLFECDYDTPIKKKDNDNCLNIQCTFDEFKEGICSIENEILKSQIFTNIIEFSKENDEYALITTTPNGDLIVSSSQAYNQNLSYYCLKKNGRPYFYDNGKETSLFLENSEEAKSEGILFGIKLDGENNEKEYIMSILSKGYIFKMHDLENNTISYEDSSLIFGTGMILFYKTTIFN